MPNRVIRDGLLESEAVLSCTIEARWLFVCMILSADDLGLCEATEFKLARRADIKREHVSVALTQLADRDLVRLYSGPGVRRFAFIPRFGQRFRLMAIKHPMPPDSLLDDHALEVVREMRSRAPTTMRERTIANAIKAAAPPESTQSRIAETVPARPKSNEINDLLPKMSDACLTHVSSPPSSALVGVVVGVDVVSQKHRVDSADENSAAAAPPPRPPETPLQARPASPVKPAAIPPPRFDGLNSKDIGPTACVALAQTFEIAKVWGEDAERLGWSKPGILREAERFRQYWCNAGNRRSVKGWRAAWGNWLRKAEKLQGGAQ